MPSALNEKANWTVSVSSSISEVPAKEWDTCAGKDDPLVFHRHLLALETSGIAAPENGFSPCHIVLRDLNGKIIAVAPTYLKTHSRGELGVDLGLELAHKRAIGAYYPKLQVEVPMAPFAGDRLLVHPDADRSSAIRALSDALKTLADEKGASSVQISYMRQDRDIGDLAAQDYTKTETNYYLWQAEGDRTFEDFLVRMKSVNRSKIRWERQKIAARHLRFEYLSGESLDKDIVLSFFERYKDNFDRHKTDYWLNKRYFEEVFDEMAGSIDLLTSFDQDKLNGVNFSLFAGRSGYSLYWGQSNAVPFLHFEQTYYRGIERALERGLHRLDFGPTGAHKAERGLRAVPAYHALWFRNRDFREVCELSCQHKMEAADFERRSEVARLPFRSEG
jgi:predicted N-acyltransferase